MEIREMYLLGKLVSVAAVGIHSTERGGSASVAEQMHELVDAFRVADVETRRMSVMSSMSYKRY